MLFDVVERIQVQELARRGGGVATVDELAGMFSELRADGNEDAPAVESEVTWLAIAETNLVALDVVNTLHTVYHLPSSDDRSLLETLSRRFKQTLESLPPNSQAVTRLCHEYQNFAIQADDTVTDELKAELHSDAQHFYTAAIVLARCTLVKYQLLHCLPCQHRDALASAHNFVIALFEGHAYLLATMAETRRATGRSRSRRCGRASEG